MSFWARSITGVITSKLESRFVARLDLLNSRELTRMMLQGVLTHLASVEYQMDSLSPPTNLEILITGSVPAGSGLSSSAAITTASVITVLSVLEVDVNRGDLTQVAIKCGTSPLPHLY